MEVFGIIGHGYSDHVGQPPSAVHGQARAPALHFILVPKLLLGNLSGCEALLRSGNKVPPHLGSAKRSLAGNCVPKPELGNEKGIGRAVHADLRRPQAALWAIPASIIRSPGFSPARTSTWSPICRPSFTWRSWAVWSTATFTMVSWPTVLTAVLGDQDAPGRPQGQRQPGEHPRHQGRVFQHPGAHLEGAAARGADGKDFGDGELASNFTAGTLTWAISPIFTCSR